MTMTLFFRQQPTLVVCTPGRGGVGDLYDDDGSEDDDNGDNNEDHLHQWQWLGQRNDNDLIFWGNNQPWLDAFLAEGGWVISTMMTMMNMWTTIANDNN